MEMDFLEAVLGGWCECAHGLVGELGREPQV